jgi:putative transposase
MASLLGKMNKFLNKYRVPSARAPWWDYANNGAYFITICTNNREQYFGGIIDGEMVLSEMGIVVNTICKLIPNQFDYSELGEFIIMPNHVHLIVIINKPVETPLMASLQTQSKTQTPLTDQLKNGGFAGYKNPMLQNNLSRVIRWFKGRCTFDLRKIHADFDWQSRFYDRIIRNEIEYQIITNYIKNNPMKWEKDKFEILMVNNKIQ